jgi:hypothetical protein
MPNLFRHLIRMARVKKCYASEILKQVQDTRTNSLRWGYTKLPKLSFRRVTCVMSKGCYFIYFSCESLRQQALRPK